MFCGSSTLTALLYNERMPTVAVPITRLPNAVTALPSYQTAGAAGMDLPAAVAEPVTLQAGEYRLIPCGFAVALPEGYEAQVRPRSGLASKFGVTVLNAPGTIDADYRGEVCVLLINHGKQAFTVKPGERIAQLVIGPVSRIVWQEVEILPETPRGEGGFGHTGQ
jgi:dUTP pyrophosphatase